MLPRKRNYTMFVSWAPTHGGGVNAVMHGLAAANADTYDSTIVVTGFVRPQNYAGPWLYLPDLNPARPLGYLARLIPSLWKLHRLLKDSVAANPHFASLECLPVVLLRKLRLGPPVILSIHGLDVTDMLAATGMRRKLLRWMFESADLVVGCSHSLTRRLLEVAPGARTATAWNAATPAPAVRPERPTPGPYLICVAGFEHKKGQDILIQAFERVLEVRPELNLVLIGATPKHSSLPKLEAQIELLCLSQKVKILTNQPNTEVWWWIRHAECLVLPSRAEPFGIVLLEAAKSHVPVVATRVGGIPEFVTDGVDGLLCDSENPEQLAEKILETLAGPEAAAKRVETFAAKAETFTWAAAWDVYRREAGLP